MNGTSYIALGLMSGTSLDGVDAAFIKTDGVDIHDVGPSLSLPYSPEDKDVLNAATQSALRWQFKGPRPNSLLQAEEVLHAAHIMAIRTLLEDHRNWADQLDIIGFHGQTMLHHPAGNGRSGQTLQIGDGQKLADAFNVPCAYDFRSADVAAGGQGAPLAPIYHKALSDFAELKGMTAILNLGGVGNVTLIGPGLLKATDTGPGNGPLDSWMQRHGQDFDDGGALSLSGMINFGLMEKWIAGDFFKRDLPRSADRYDFDVLTDLQGQTLESGAATLAAFTAFSVKHSMAQMDVSPNRLILCGGGRYNKAMRLMLKSEIGCEVLTAEQVGWNADMIEAQAFAYLAVRCLKGLPISFPDTTGVPEPMTGGQIAYPA